MGWKYIHLLQVSPSGIQWHFPLIFPDKLVHADVARAATLLPPLNRRLEFGLPRNADPFTVISAGMIDGVRVNNLYGESETLRKKSNPDQDRLLIDNYQYNHGIL